MEGRAVAFEDVCTELRTMAFGNKDEELTKMSAYSIAGILKIFLPRYSDEAFCHAHYGPAWLTAGSRGRSRHWPVRYE